MSSVKERFLRYVQVETTSCEANECCPSTPGQRVLGEMLVSEMKEMGVQGAFMDEHGYVYGSIPAKGAAGAPVIGLIAASLLSIGTTVFTPAVSTRWLPVAISGCLFILMSILSFKKKHPILIIALSAVIGIITGYTLGL